MTCLNDVQPFKTACSVHVKVLHTWKSCNPNFGSSIEMVLADENGVKIHASCKQSLLQHFEKHFRVGEWKVISNFTLSPATGLYRPTNHVYKMDFVNSMFLKLHDFANIINGLHDTCFLIDVIGEVLDFGGLQNVHCARKEVIKVEFTLRDINNHRIYCCIFGNLAEILTEAVKQTNNGDICLIRYAKISKYKGELQVSNAFDTSLVLINPDIKEAQSLKQMFHGDANAIEDQEVLPPEIVEIVGKTYEFGISDDENNMIGGADKFNAMKVWNLNDIMWKRIKSLHQILVDRSQNSPQPGNHPMPALGIKIHATCKKNYLKSLGEQCKAGEWKTLYNFQTVIKPSEFQNDDMFLSLGKFDSIMSGKLDNDILIGNLQISNGYDSSQLVFNPHIKEAVELREAYKFHDDSMSIVETSEEGKDVVSQANDGTGQITGWEAVELHLMAKDDTAKAKFVPLDWVAWPVIGVKAEKISMVEDFEMLPDCINEIVGKTYNFGVTIEKRSETFKVLKAWSVYNTLMVDSQSESTSGKGITANSASEVSLLTYSDESSSKMATPSKRSVDDIVDIPDNTSTSKMRPVKSIKIEKMSSDEQGLRKN
ncbi:hypothetical protein HID58_074573 [Brassica napus]|uniref:Replication protein A 70 kDa DNA-binding subunit B/D first OB fold domain-containing protein n=1 Tax=Brassica napus TaxID=3708 RepID=A0ABQ7YK83_BRANA|nr:hypothetical protein HID58_074573 [Brassica napus]